MKKVLLFLTLSFFAVEGFSMDCTAATSSGGVTSNDCAETALAISTCGTAFSITSAQMSLATPDCTG